MRLPKTLALLLCLLATACAGFIENASLNEAYKHYQRGDYERTLELIAQAEAMGEPVPPERQAERTYLKAKTYEQLGDRHTARTLYAYLAEQHGDTQYGYLASKVLGEKP